MQMMKEDKTSGCFLCLVMSCAKVFYRNWNIQGDYPSNILYFQCKDIGIKTSNKSSKSKYLPIFMSAGFAKISVILPWSLLIPKSQTSFSPTPSPRRHTLTRNPYFLHTSDSTSCFKHFWIPFAAINMLTSYGFCLKRKKMAEIFYQSREFILYFTYYIGLA